MSKFLRVRYYAPNQSTADFDAVLNLNNVTHMVVDGAGSAWRIDGVSGGIADSDGYIFYLIMDGFSTKADAIIAMNKIVQAVDPADLV